MKFGTGTRWHGDTGTRDEIWHGDTGARMARRARDLSDS